MARGRLLVLRGQSATLNVAWRKALHRPQPSATVVSSLRRTDQSRFVKFVKKMGWKKEWEEKFQEHYSRVNVHTQLP
jgi:hypothetical protein